MSKSRPSATRAPMAGRAANRHSSCCGAPPGIDCSDYSLTVKDQRRLEGRQWRRTEVPQPAAPLDPLVDLSDCRHGCNGDCVESGSERCDFTCHAEAPAVDAGA
jgi:hypothetical protein